MTASEQPAQKADQDMDRTLSGTKRKEVEPERKRHSFKAVANLVLAMRRFSNSLNPTYTYGKRPSSSSSGGPSKTVTEDVEAHVVSSGKHVPPCSSTGGRATSPHPGSPEAHDQAKYAYNTHGHKFDFLLKPLPPTEEEELAVGAPPQ